VRSCFLLSSAQQQELLPSLFGARKPEKLHFICPCVFVSGLPPSLNQGPCSQLRHGLHHAFHSAPRLQVNSTPCRWRASLQRHQDSSAETPLHLNVCRAEHAASKYLKNEYRLPKKLDESSLSRNLSSLKDKLSSAGSKKSSSAYATGQRAH